MAIEENEGCFKCLKITLIVLYVLGLIATLIFLILTIIGVVYIDDVIDSSKDPHFTPEERQDAKYTAKLALIVLTAMLALSMLVQIVGLIGIIKQNKCILITLAVFSGFGLIGYLVTGHLVAGAVAAVDLLLIVLYTYIVIKRSKAN